ncbi:MAG: hypothetical protein A2231_01390 [Candidatus Firestonebacteria bacterium RIFOXYA2_FULL_40_8]|nr:MAG: hypothetical protein A2231_01390 [Candidatus Firestonebacteria bacterium RIFOXYA2_FULL_40_8]
MSKYVCKKCGLAVFDVVPEACLVCYSPKEEFVPAESLKKNTFYPENFIDPGNWSGIEYPKRIRNRVFGNGYRSRRIHAQ